ncbi:hypothetical protein [Pontiella sp.]|uniref:hypothetical protein n=1 Tax=Pontiella sp. TaxID=2837462 RepID=UPI003568EF7B
MDFELLNVPDTAAQADYKVRLELLNLAGNVVHVFPVRELASSGVAETRFRAFADSKLAFVEVLRNRRPVFSAPRRRSTSCRTMKS